MSIAATIVKANAGWKCSECGSTEYVQAHHEIPGDDSSMISLCAEHHSQRHPDVPKALFFNHTSQPYWHNKSAASLARELGVHPRTIIRVARRLQISSGELNLTTKTLIKDSIPKANQIIARKQLTTQKIEGFLKVRQASEIFKVSDGTIQRWLSSGKLKGFKRGGNGKSKHHWFIRRADLEAFMAGAGADVTGFQADSEKRPDSGKPQSPLSSNDRR